jgi:uncharacterized protein (TIGR03118 family)
MDGAGTEQGRPLVNQNQPQLLPSTRMASMAITRAAPQGRVPGAAAEMEDAMRVMSMLALGVMGAGMGSGCGEANEPSTTQAPASTPAQESTLFTLRSPRIEATVKQRDIVSNLHLDGVVQDDNLQNAWGLAFAPQGVAWVASNGGGFLEAYNADGSKRIEVPVLGPDGAAEAPSGQVFNPDSATTFKGDVFIAVTEDGTVVGWQPGFTQTQDRVPATGGAIYKGVAIAKVDGKTRLYAADFFNGKVDVFDDDYNLLKIHGDFRDKDLPENYAPFNLLTVGDDIIVTFAEQKPNKVDDAKGPGHGFVDMFDTNGRLDARLISRGALNSPWGLALRTDAKDKKGSVDLLVGNFGDGHINVYDLSLRHERSRADFEGVIADTSGKPLFIDGLWAIVFGPGAGGFEADDLYFTAGPNEEADGVFGELEFVKHKR